MDTKRRAFARFHGHLTVLNDLLLIPMFTMLVAEASLGDQGAHVLAFSTANLGFSLSFLTEWVLGLVLAESRRAYLLSFEKGIDLVSAIPLGDLFQTFRAARLLRLFRVVRVIVRVRKFQGKGAKIVRLVGVVGATIFAGALGLRIAEPQTARDMGDGLWWALSTVSTVGYGDIVPKTTFGRSVGAVLVFFGIGVFGYVAGFMSSLMTNPEEDEILMTVRRLEAKVDALTKAHAAERDEE